MVAEVGLTGLVGCPERVRSGRSFAAGAPMAGQARIAARLIAPKVPPTVNFMRAS